MAISDIRKTNTLKTIQQSSSANSAVSSNASINVPVGQYQYDELLKKLNITREQLEIILKEVPDFLSKSYDEQLVIVLSDELDPVVPEVPLITKDDLKSLPALSPDDPSYDEVCDLFFNSSPEDKKHILAIELLKNEITKENEKFGPEVIRKKFEEIGPGDIRNKIEEIKTKINNASQNSKDGNPDIEPILDRMFFTIAEANVRQKSYKELCDNFSDHNLTSDDKISLGRITDYMLLYANRCKGEGIEVNSNLVKRRAERVLLTQDAFKAQVEQLKQKLSPELLAEFEEKIGNKDITCSAEMDKYIEAYFDFIKENWDKVKDLDIVKNNLTVTQIIYSYMEANNSNGVFTARLEKLKPRIEKERKLGSFGVEEVADNDRICKFENELPATDDSEVLADFYYQKIEEEVKKQFGITGDDIPADKRADFNKELARRIRAAALDAYNPPHGDYDLGDVLVKKLNEFCTKNNLELDIGKGSFIEVATQVLVENGTLEMPVVQHIYDEYIRHSEETGDTTGLDVLMSGVAKRSDADTIMEYISEMISNSETMSDATKDLIKKHVENYRANSANSPETSGKTSQGSISKSSSSSTSEVETAPAQYTAYQTNPIANDRVEPVQTPTTEAAKSVYEQIVSGKVSASKIAEVFNSLSSDEKVNVLKSLTSSEIIKMPVSICGLCPEFIPQFVAAKKGIEVIRTVPDAAAATILHMKKSNDRDVQKDLQVFMIEHPDQFMKISVANAREKLGVREDDNRPINHIRFRA